LASGAKGFATSIQSFNIQGRIMTAAESPITSTGPSSGLRARHNFHTTKPTAYGSARNAVYFTA
jgi:hypothetical protein